MAETQSRGRSVLADRDTWWADPIGESHEGRPNGRRWWVGGILFLLPFLIPATQDLLRSALTARTALEWLLFYGYGAFYLAFPLMFEKERRPKLLFGLAMLVTGIVTVMVPGASSFVLLYATATIAFLLPAAWALIFDVGGMLLAVALLFAAGRLAESTDDLGSVAGVTAAMFFMSNLIRAIRRLEIANREIGALAVATERERVARDLHDLLGHSLTTITVKAGLARRMLESSGDIPHAVQEIREVEGLTRSALSDVRATVTEYREVSLPAEIAGARAALRAAEIEADLPHAVDNVRAELRSTFGYVLREAVTNVLRHSGASRVKVRMGCGWLEVEDDGRAAEVVAGNGLRGLSERLAAVGGTLRTTVRPGGGLAVRAEVPEPDLAAAPAVRAETAGGLA
ncbi:sensor histidine kinase [Amycolatopsis saalfeldensis]|uniref:Two-component system, NarL family, sensor histidine kinase DesK n=1 Tax=Amycolatopsis saalfeldensis TaxID=394193 RepID=A0A1H8Y010_9PSEU|nr:histidine kinase [Amycolatopsis saalfeldensis]SEP45362.1 two-component system, NarL family, sensor histidine kinase DesK [Amycolatopsis saalfeldensis]